MARSYPGLIAIAYTLAFVYICIIVQAHPQQQQHPIQVGHEHSGLPASSSHGHSYLVNWPKMADYRYRVNDENCKMTVKTPPKLNHTTLNKKLVPFVFEPLPLGSVKPLGWMKDQMQLMAEGFPGQMHTFYRLVKSGTWVGGDQEYADLNEAWPYWYNGFVALAYGLDDDRLKQEVERATEYVLKHQFSDGWFGPEHDVRRRNFWGRYPFLLGLMQLVEARGVSESKRYLNAIHHFVQLMHRMLDDHNAGYVRDNGHRDDQFDEQWGRSRASDMVIFLEWLYETDPRNNTAIIYNSMVHFYQQSWDWTYWFQDDVFVKSDFDDFEDDPRWCIFPYIHGVNAGQGLKYGAVMRRLTHMDDYARKTRQGTNLTFEYHGSASGAIIGDEGLSGNLPYRGVELCSVVETMYSLTYSYQALGDRYFADRAELAAYNALPVMISDDWWAHAYLAQINQPVAHELEHQPFWNVGPMGITLGLEPNYPCCAVNFPQGLPKYLSATFVRDGKNGIAHAFLMPAEVKTTIGHSNKVHVRCDTNYPFEHDLTYTVKATSGFDFSFRIPSWVETYSVTIGEHIQTFDANEEQQQQSKQASNGLFKIPIGAGSTTIQVRFHDKPTPRIEERPNDTIAIHHGSLLYALPIPAQWTSSRPANYPEQGAAPLQAKDYKAEPLSTFKWNIAIDPSTLKFHPRPSNEANQPLPNPIWTINAPPTRISVMACELANWELTHPKEKGYAPAPPAKENRRCVGDAFEVWLQPYGACKVHMAEFPTFDLSSVGLA